jgi:hypothetical protein
MQSESPYSWRSTVGVIADAWNNWRERRRELARLDDVGTTEVSEVAQELGLSVAELRTLVGRGKNSAELLQRRLQVLGISPNRIEPGVMRDLQRCCSQCHDKALCAHELEDRPKEASWPSYCPNEQTIQALRAEERKPDGHKGDALG